MQGADLRGSGRSSPRERPRSAAMGSRPARESSCPGGGYPVLSPFLSSSLLPARALPAIPAEEPLPYQHASVGCDADPSTCCNGRLQSAGPKMQPQDPNMSSRPPGMGEYRRGMATGGGGVHPTEVAACAAVSPRPHPPRSTKGRPARVRAPMAAWNAVHRSKLPHRVISTLGTSITCRGRKGLLRPPITNPGNSGSKNAGT